MYVYINMYIYIYVCVCMLYIYIYIYIYIYVNMYIYMYIVLHFSICLSLFVYSMFIDIYTCMIHKDKLGKVGARLGTWFPHACAVSSSTSAASEAEETCSWQEIGANCCCRIYRSILSDNIS